MVVRRVVVALLLLAVPLASADGLPPEPPGNLSAFQDPVTGQLTLTWQAAVGADGYHVYRNAEHVATVLGLAFTDEASGAPILAYTVHAFNDSGEGSPASLIRIQAVRVGHLVSPPAVDQIIDGQGLPDLSCGIFVFGLTPAFPYAAQVRYDCLPSFLAPLPGTEP